MAFTYWKNDFGRITLKDMVETEDFKHSDIRINLWETRKFQHGTRRHDRLRATGDENTFLAGHRGHDTLIGGNGNDFLFGGSGNDTLYASRGTDFLAGGSGKDTFSFNLANRRIDDIAIIQDFRDIGDRIEFRNVDPHAGLTQAADGSVQVWANTNVGRQMIASIRSPWESSVFEVGNNYIELVDA